MAQDQALAIFAKPGRCVALHQGQTCYSKVTFRWRELNDKYNYCIVENGASRPLHCWIGGQAGHFVYDFGSNKSVRYQLMREDEKIIAETEVQVAWVYKSRQRRSTGWRLF